MRAPDYPSRGTVAPPPPESLPSRVSAAHLPGPAARWRRTRHLAQALVLTALLGLLAACGSAPTRPLATAAPLRIAAHMYPPPADPQASNEVLIRALGLVGTPYRYGGNTPAGGFDCSGLVGFVFRDAASRILPRTTSALVAMRAPAVGALELEPGDLVFFAPGGGAASHIGIFVGEGRFVHAPATGGTVRLDRLDAEYWRRSLVAARRVLH